MQDENTLKGILEYVKIGDIKVNESRKKSYGEDSHEIVTSFILNSY